MALLEEDCEAGFEGLADEGITEDEGDAAVQLRFVLALKADIRVGST